MLFIQNPESIRISILEENGIQIFYFYFFDFLSWLKSLLYEDFQKVRQGQIFHVNIIMKLRVLEFILYFLLIIFCRFCNILVSTDFIVIVFISSQQQYFKFIGFIGVLLLVFYYLLPGLILLQSAQFLIFDILSISINSPGQPLIVVFIFNQSNGIPKLKTCLSNIIVLLLILLIKINFIDQNQFQSIKLIQSIVVNILSISKNNIQVLGVSSKDSSSNSCFIKSQFIKKKKIVT
eukprot:TRINITY_DN12452_c0_g1_i1.p1 TRINITY_DN12452_c0_g1~~TRINITY_DN12452_c0_g1_i1.p1  ORF type:complete len:235 (-),score=-12.55 TRINITY_DN12452_c0_g1_i1:376-1080(-)